MVSTLIDFLEKRHSTPTLVVRLKKVTWGNRMQPGLHTGAGTSPQSFELALCNFSSKSIVSHSSGSGDAHAFSRSCQRNSLHPLPSSIPVFSLPCAFRWRRLNWGIRRPSIVWVALHIKVRHPVSKTYLMDKIRGQFCSSDASNFRCSFKMSRV